MDPNSEQRLNQVSPTLAAKVRAAAVALAAKGIQLRVVQGLRTIAEQNALFAKGPSVTRATGGYSSHNFGLAVNAVPGVLGTTPWQPQWSARAPEFVAMVEEMKRQGLAWGGDWIHMARDFDHFYLANSPADPTDQMRADLSKGLEVVFSQCDAGSYA